MVGIAFHEKTSKIWCFLGTGLNCLISTLPFHYLPTQTLSILHPSWVKISYNSFLMTEFCDLQWCMHNDRVNDENLMFILFLISVSISDPRQINETGRRWVLDYFILVCSFWISSRIVRGKLATLIS